jgi:polyisoprenoid-binding protein YceI
MMVVNLVRVQPHRSPFHSEPIARTERTVTFEGAGGDQWGGQRIAFSASGELDREQWGMHWNQALETGGFVIGKKVKLDLEVEAVKQG